MLRCALWRLPTWVPDGETKPAPMPLLVVQSFVNTWEGDAGVDLLGIRLKARVGSVRPGWRTAPRSTSPGRGRSGRASGPCWSRTAVRTAPAPADLVALRALADAADLRGAVRDDGSVDVQPAGGWVGGAAPDHPRCAARRLVGAAEGLSQSGLPLGLLRPLACRPRRLVRHGGVRQPDEEPESALAPVGRPGRSHGSVSRWRPRRGIEHAVSGRARPPQTRAAPGSNPSARRPPRPRSGSRRGRRAEWAGTTARSAP